MLSLPNFLPEAGACSHPTPIYNSTHPIIINHPSTENSNPSSIPTRYYFNTPVRHISSDLYLFYLFTLCIGHLATVGLERYVMSVPSLQLVGLGGIRVVMI